MSKMIYIEAVSDLNEANQGEASLLPRLFLAGGITNCPDWQSSLISLIDHLPIVVFNPRRANFPYGNKQESEKQILWEAHALKQSDAVSFWFPKETVCPITLFELGAMLQTDKEIITGCHAEYTRLLDLQVQIPLYWKKKHLPDDYLVHDLETLAEKIAHWAESA